MYSSKTQTQTSFELDEIRVPYKEYRYLKDTEVCFYVLVVAAMVMVTVLTIISIGEY